MDTTTRLRVFRSAAVCASLNSLQAERGYPSTNRNYVALQYTSPKYAFIPASVIKRYKRFSPNRFGVGRGQPLASQKPGFTLFGVGGSKVAAHAVTAPKATPVTAKAVTVTPKASTATAAAKAAATNSSAATFTTSTYQQQTVDSFVATLAKALGGSTSTTTASAAKKTV